MHSLVLFITTNLGVGTLLNFRGSCLPETFNFTPYMPAKAHQNNPYWGSHFKNLNVHPPPSCRLTINPRLH